LLASFQSNYVPKQTITIDEAMISFKGRLSFKQYMKDKLTKWGIKVFLLSDASNTDFKYIVGRAWITVLM